MSKFIDKCKCSVNKALDNTFFQNIANIILLVVVAILIISLMLSPAILIALALFCLFLWAILYF